jgi:hypothetical protein
LLLHDVVSRRDYCLLTFKVFLVKIIQYFICFFISVFVYADDLAEKKEVVVEIKLQNHIFDPAEIYVPSNKKIILVVHNLDPTVEEFDSPSLRREKILRSNSTTRIILAPLAPGRYDFVGELYQDTAKGVVIVE